MKNKISALILSILILSFSIVPSFSDNNGIMTLAVSTQYTIDQILENKTIGYNYDSFYDNSFNLLTYLNYLNTDEGHVCSTFNSKYCTILNYYNSFLSDYEEVGSSYNYYVLTDLSSSKFAIYYLFSDSELSVVNDRFYIPSGDVRLFIFNGSFEYYGDIIPWNFSSYSENTSFNYPGSVSGILLSNADIYDGEGNLVFEKNMNIEEPEPEPEGSDVTLGGISNIIDGVKDGLTDLKNTITDFIKDLTAPLEFLKERFQSSTIITGIIGVVEYITNFFAEASDGMLIIKEFFATMPDKFIYFFWGPFVVLLIVAFVGRLLR